MIIGTAHTNKVGSVATLASTMFVMFLMNHPLFTYKKHFLRQHHIRNYSKKSTFHQQIYLLET